MFLLYKFSRSGQFSGILGSLPELSKPSRNKIRLCCVVTALFSIVPRLFKHYLSNLYYLKNDVFGYTSLML